MESKYTISIFVNNKPGVLMRLSQTFARRGYNIDSLVVSPSRDSKFSRLTVAVQGNEAQLEQILRQLNKLVDVLHAIHHLNTDSVERELALFKVKVSPEKRSEIFQVVEVFRAKIIDITEHSIILETTGNSSKIDALEELLATMGVVEMVRSGKLAMVRGVEQT